MENNNLIERLSAYGLTRQEASIYLAMLQAGEMSGYEVAKETGISRSNVYGSLAGLLDKGAVYQIEGTSVKYVPVAPEQFCENTLRKLKADKEYLLQHLPKKLPESEGYITIQGYRHILDKMIEMMERCEKRIYIAADESILRHLAPSLEKAYAKGIRIVVLTPDEYEPVNTEIYHTHGTKEQIRFITDSSHVLTGEISGEKSDTCLYSGQQNLVTLIKEALSSQIALAKQEERKDYI